MPTQPTREEELFHEALELPAGPQRSAFLQKACAGDETLRRGVEALLRAHAEAGTVLEPVVPRQFPDSATAPVTEKPGDQIGRYKLLQVIGEGGFGIVYMAEQHEPVRRRLALKIIKLGMDTKQVVARFEAERQALALMDHPNIAKVFDAGATETGRPFFVMELVRGVPITEYCDQNRLSTPQRLELFILVCKAIQHAHQKGIIHRDVKPSNVLVTLHDGVPVPKVIDFGIAKAIDQPLTDKTLFTRFEQFMGTPAYMSPEQAEMSGLGVDTRTDIYALGVLLYELLTGKTPFDPQQLLACGLDEMRRTIREQDPPKPSTRLGTLSDADLTTVAGRRGAEPRKLPGLVSGDLDWVVMKALEKDRTRRYETANGLAADIQHHLSNEPVLACPPGNLYRFQKLVRRNKLAFLAASVVTGALIIGLGVSTWMFFQEQQARQQADAERKKAQTEAAKSQQVAQFLKDMLEGVGPSVALGRDSTMLREILDKTTERVGKDLKAQPAARAELLTTIGPVYHALGQYAKAEAVGREALALNKELFGNDGLAVAESLDNLADTLHEEDKNVEGEAIVREALAIQRKLSGTKSVVVARSLQILGKTLSGQKKHAEAETPYREALAMRKELLGSENPDVALSLMGVAGVAWHQGKVAEAEADYREVLAIQKKAYGAEHPDMEIPLDNLANLLIEQGKLAEGEAVVREVLALQRKMLGDAHPHLVRSLWILTGVLQRQGKLAEAETIMQETLALQRKLLGNEGPEVVSVLNNLAGILIAQGKLAESEGVVREALVVQKKMLGNENPQLVGSLLILTDVLRRQGKLAKTEAVLREALAVQRKMPGDENPQLVGSLWILTDVLREEGKVTDGETLGRELVSVQRKRFGNEDPEVGAALTRLGEFVAAQGRLTEAETLYRQAAEIERKPPANQDRPELLQWSLEALGNVLNQQGKVSEAEASYREELEISRKSWTNNPGKWEAPANALAGVLTRQGKYREAEQVFNELLTPTIESQTNSAGLVRAREELRARNAR